MYFKPLLFLVAALLFSCNMQPAIKKAPETIAAPLHTENPYNSIGEIPLPEGYNRVPVAANSFAEWLRQVSLKKDKTVYKYDGKPKANQSAQFAILDVSVGNKDLQQCADAVMRLRAEYLFAQKKFNEIIFYDNNYAAYQFTPPYNRTNFMNYLERVFGMCGSASLSKQLNPVSDFKSIAPGNVIIRGGFPGHAVIVLDVAVNAAGKKIYLLAQSYMPAQDIHVLLNPADEILSPWYKASDSTTIFTPEYVFEQKELRQW